MLTFRQCVRLACAFFFSFSSAHSLSLTVLAMFALSVELHLTILLWLCTLCLHFQLFKIMCRRLCWLGCIVYRPIQSCLWIQKAIHTYINIHIKLNGG